MNQRYILFAQIGFPNFTHQFFKMLFLSLTSCFLVCSSVWKENIFFFTVLKMFNIHSFLNFPKLQAILSCSYDCFYFKKISQFIENSEKAFFCSSFFSLFLKKFIRVQVFYKMCQFLLYNNQLYVYIYTLLFGFSFHLDHHRVLIRVPCAIQKVFISYLFYAQYKQCIYVNPNFPITFLKVSFIEIIYIQKNLLLKVPLVEF